MIDWTLIKGFDWDAGNARKLDDHKVYQTEAEEVFFNEPLLITADIAHSQDKPRYHALGRTRAGRMLHATFTLRWHASLIRMISVRDMHRKERQHYENQISSSDPTL